MGGVSPGFEVGHATRTVKECIRMAGDDIKILMSLLDGRFICGMSNLFIEMSEGLRKKVIRSRSGKVISMLVEGSRERHIHFGDSSYLLEPNLKEGLGGLRDFHTMLWIARVKSDLRQPMDLVYSGYLGEKEFQAIEKAVLFISDVRNRLHHLNSRKCDQLYLEHQKLLAESMKYKKKNGQEPVERFLGALHGQMELLKQQQHLFFSELGYSKIPKQRGRIFWKRTRVKGLKVDKRNMLDFVSMKTILNSPELLMKIFEECARLSTPLSATAKRIVKELSYLVDDNFRKSPTAVKAFENILTAPSASFSILNEMLTTGFLVRFIPEIGGIVNRIQYNEYHIFPVDKHSLQTVQTVKSFKASDDRERSYYDLYKELSEKKLLLWACLLHDIGKSEPSGKHSESGARITKEILQRKGFNARDIETITFLIREHLFLIKIATRRDINDEGTAIFCVQKIKDLERLKMLYLLTVADSMSTGPKAWNDWSSTLLRELFLKVFNILKKGELATKEAVNVVESKKKDITRFISENKEGEDIDLILDTLSPRYFLYVPARDILSHISLYHCLGDSELVWDVKKDVVSNTRIVTVCAKNRPGLFSKIAGVLTLSNLDILDAQIYTWKNNIALDIFHVTPPRDQIFEEEIWKRAEKDLCEALRHNVNLSIRKRKILETKPEKLHTLKQPHHINIDNATSDFFTIIEVFTYDFPGLLFSITDTLYRNNFDIYVAKIATKVDQVVDIFYVRDLYGEKIDTKDQVAEIKSAINDVLPTTDKEAA